MKAASHAPHNPPDQNSDHTKPATSTAGQSPALSAGSSSPHNTPTQHCLGDWKGPSHDLWDTGTSQGQGVCLSHPKFDWLP